MAFSTIKWRLFPFRIHPSFFFSEGFSLPLEYFPAFGVLQVLFWLLCATSRKAVGKVVKRSLGFPPRVVCHFPPGKIATPTPYRNFPACMSRSILIRLLFPLKKRMKYLALHSSGFFRSSCFDVSSLSSPSLTTIKLRGHLFSSLEDIPPAWRNCRNLSFYQSFTL